MFKKTVPGEKPGNVVDDPPVGFLSSADALLLLALVKQELIIARDIADDSPAWLAQAQALERILPVLKGAEIIVIE